MTDILDDGRTAGERKLDLLILSAGVIEGGTEQVVVKVLDAIVRDPRVLHWGFERTARPAPTIRLLLDIDRNDLMDVVEQCEELLSTSLTDRPDLEMRPLVELSNAQSDVIDAGWGVRHFPISAPRSDVGPQRHWRLEQALGEAAIRVLRNVDANQWDRKTIAPALLEAILDATGEGNFGHLAFAIMQTLLGEDPGRDAIIRRFRQNAHALQGKLNDALATSPEVAAARTAVADQIAAIADELADVAADQRPPMIAEVWRRLSGAIGFTTIEAAYIACLVASRKAAA